MTVALDETLITKGIASILIKGGSTSRKSIHRTNGTDIFIGAGVTEEGETPPDIDLCGVNQALLGIVGGYVSQLETIDNDGYFYRDYNNPFGDNKWVWVFELTQDDVCWILSDTNKTIAIGNKVMCVDGVFYGAASSNNYQFVALTACTAAANTRRYFKAKFVKN